jgi:signal peptidase II
MPGEKPTSWRPKNFLLVFAGVLFFDQLLKRISFQSGNYVENRKGLFGLETNPQFSFLALGLFLAIILSAFRSRKSIARLYLPLALLLGGILSNLLDRIRLGFIIDHISLQGICAFNLADIAISFGALIFIWRITKE